MSDEKARMDDPDPMIVAATYPAPWRIKLKPGTNRAAIFDNGDALVIAGMNLLKARIIVAAINRDHRHAEAEGKQGAG
jgi:hypothetical protein